MDKMNERAGTSHFLLAVKWIGIKENFSEASIQALALFICSFIPENRIFAVLFISCELISVLCVIQDVL